MVVANLMKNAATSREVLRRLIPQIPLERTCACASALQDAIITSRDRIPPEEKEKLFPILGKYLSQGGV